MYCLIACGSVCLCMCVSVCVCVLVACLIDNVFVCVRLFVRWLRWLVGCVFDCTVGWLLV